MPILEYVCPECTHQFERIVLTKDVAYGCPQCHGTVRTPKISVPGQFKIGHHKALEICELE